MPKGGVWRVSFSVESRVTEKREGEMVHENMASLYHNNQKMHETEHYTVYDGRGYMLHTGGREVLVRAQQGDTLHFTAEWLGFMYYQIIVCFEFVNF